jgi:hypothetical protein
VSGPAAVSFVSPTARVGIAGGRGRSGSDGWRRLPAFNAIISTPKNP